VTSLGGAPANSLTFNHVQASAPGSYYLTVYAAVDGSGTYSLNVNGANSGQIAVSGTNIALPATSGSVINLFAGDNSITFSNPVSPAPDLDHIVITPKGAASPGFDIVYPIPGVTISAPGQSGTALVTLIPANGFSGEVLLECSFSPAVAGASCNGSTVSLNGGSPATGSIVINTKSSGITASAQKTFVRLASLSSMRLGGRGSMPSNRLLQLVALPLLGLPRTRRRKPRRQKLPRLLLSGVVLSLIAGMAGCGGGVKPAQSVLTAPGTYTLTIIATSGALTQTATCNVLVQ
jgi:hypothetical protein